VTPGHRPRKRFGQHFLEAAWVTRLVDLLSAQPNDTFLEIGPGRGALTARLAPRVARLLCVEIDRDLSALLRESMPRNVEITTGDFLEANVRELSGPGTIEIRVVGNLPYNISSPILFKLLRDAEGPPRLIDATLMLQKEVADRLAAAPGTEDYGVLAVQTARVAEVTTLLTLPPGAFRPPPRVTSAVVQLRFRPSPVDVGDPGTFERVVRGAFLQRRKMLVNALEPVLSAVGRSPREALERAGIDPRKRPEALTLAEFARLSRAVL
jgi:16S rRNA (adenine1518-N6/adenine1519-N6)-dimethyltransferase